MTAESSKILAGIGSILMLIPALNIVGIILVLIGMKGLSEHYKDDSIYRNALTGVIFGIIGFVTLTLGIFSIGILSFFTTTTVYSDTSTAISALAAIPFFVLLVVVLFVFMLLMALYFRKALYALADRSGEQLFRTAGTLLFIGAILTVIVVGLFLIWIAYLLLIIAFFSLKIAPITSSYSYTPPPTAQPYQTAPTENKANFCPNCGTPIAPETAFCSHCGKQI
ncbi:MAG: DUF996 domain-containing protein [Nitrososphaerota archaeon]|jgi:uncharacterized membrane protein|nr:DUF996 domain-containing protein [Nitrososphaerota archaeon]